MPPAAPLKDALAKKGGLTLSQLVDYDDRLTDALVDRVCYWTEIRKLRPGFHPIRGVREEDVCRILQQDVILKKDPVGAAQKLLELPGLKKYSQSLKTKDQREHFHRHLAKYVRIWMPDCPFEVGTTNRYTITTHEACVIARREIPKGEVVKYLTGVQVAMSKKEEQELDVKKRDFSIVMSSRKKVPSLFLGPARFANHDCNANARLSTTGSNGMQIVAVRRIEVDEEITVTYGDDYFGEDNCECLCATCEMYRRNGWSRKRKRRSATTETQLQTPAASQTPAESVAGDQTLVEVAEVVAGIQTPEESVAGSQVPTKAAADHAVTADVAADFEDPAPTVSDMPTPAVSSDDTQIAEETIDTTQTSIAPLPSEPVKAEPEPEEHSVPEPEPKEEPAPQPEPEEVATPTSYSLRRNRKFTFDAKTHSPIPSPDSAAATPVGRKRQRLSDSASGSVRSRSLRTHASSQASPDAESPSLWPTPRSQKSLATKFRPGRSALSSSSDPRSLSPASSLLSHSMAPSTLTSATSPDPASDSDLSTMSSCCSFDDRAGRIVRRKRARGQAPTRQSARHRAVSTIECTPDLDSDTESVTSATSASDENPPRRPGDHVHPPISGSRYVACKNCDAVFSQALGEAGIRAACPRCERHARLYGFAWPKTDREGKADREERVLDWREVHRFVAPGEERGRRRGI